MSFIHTPAKESGKFCMRLKFLGTGDAAGIPVYGCTCAVCRAAKKDSRLCRQACSALLESGNESILIDAGISDLASRFPVGSLSRIFITHYHADHILGLFHLRWGCNTTIPIHGPDDPNGCADLLKHPGILDFSPVTKAFHTEQFDSVRVTPVPLIHSKPTLGYCFADQSIRLAYLCDTVGLPPESHSFLQEWQPSHIIVDCTNPPQESPPRNHNDYNMIVDLAMQFTSAKFWLTHISHNFDLWHQKQRGLFPENIQITRDNMELYFDKE